MPKIMLNQRCIPVDVLKAEAEKDTTMTKKLGQQKLGFLKVNKPIEFKTEGVLDAVARYVACDNQVSQIL